MYRQSFLVVVLALIVAGILLTGSRMVAAIPGFGGLPSSYDPKVSVEEAAKTSEHPLLIEFYTDSCRACQVMTPWVHEIAKRYDDRLTFVMVNLDDPQQAPMAKIFGIEYVPSFFVFDFSRMSKEQISKNDYRNAKTLEKAIDKALVKVSRAPVKNKG